MKVLKFKNLRSAAIIFSLVGLCFSAHAQKAIKKEVILEKVKAVENYVKDVRGYLHEHPELSSKEFETARFIQGELEKIGLPVTKVEGTGFYAILDTKKAGKTIGLRTDIDALPVPENAENLKQPKKWISKVEGVSHACGHDGHIAILLGAVKVLNELKGSLSGRIVFIFEEAEETGEGIDKMVNALKPLNIDAFYGNHLSAAMKTGDFFIIDGPMMAGSSIVAFDVIGRGGHGSRPDLSINPIFAAADILSGISIAWNNQRDITQTLTLGITQIHGGEANNVIPNSVFIGGTVRFFDKAEAERGLGTIKKVAENIAAAHNCTVKIREETRIMLTPVINDKQLAELGQKAVGALYPGKVDTSKENIWFASETFSKYSTLAPALFVFVGIQNDDLGSGAAHHNDRFDIDEDALPYAVGGMVGFAVEYLNAK
ncbi:MAG: amidohydrolase [Tannerella sp.]|jgi:amidohydrolase|nr:amidohydrolase [Tannerella sp.]